MPRRGGVDDAITKLRTCERSTFQRRMKLPQLGVHLVVDEATADYAPERSVPQGTRAAGGSVDVQRARRVDLANFLWSESSRPVVADGNDDENNDATSDDEALSARNSAAALKEAAELTLSALDGLPPGILESTPYLQHVQTRCNLERQAAANALENAALAAANAARPPDEATAGNAAAESEEALFSAFSESLRRRIACGDCADSPEAVQAAFRRFVTDEWPNRHRAPKGPAADQAAAALPETGDLRPRPPTGALPNKVAPLSRPATGSTRPASAKFMLTVNQKRSFLTELVERADETATSVANEQASGQSASKGEIPSGVPEHISPKRPTTAPTTSGPNTVVGPAVAPHTASAAASVAHRQEPTSSKRPDMEKAGAVLDVQQQHHAHVREVGHLRFRVRSAKSTLRLARQGICRPNSSGQNRQLENAVEPSVSSMNGAV